MGLFKRAEPQRTLVKYYGRDTLLMSANLLLAPLMSAFGLRPGLRSEADVLDRMEKDALRMADAGYEVASIDRFVVQWLARLGFGDKASYYRATYRLRA